MLSMSTPSRRRRTRQHAASILHPLFPQLHRGGGEQFNRVHCVLRQHRRAIAFQRPMLQRRCAWFLAAAHGEFGGFGAFVPACAGGWFAACCAAASVSVHGRVVGCRVQVLGLFRCISRCECAFADLAAFAPGSGFEAVAVASLSPARVA